MQHSIGVPIFGAAQRLVELDSKRPLIVLLRLPSMGQEFPFGCEQFMSPKEENQAQPPFV